MGRQQVEGRRHFDRALVETLEETADAVGPEPGILQQLDTGPVGLALGIAAVGQAEQGLADAAGDAAAGAPGQGLDQQLQTIAAEQRLGAVALDHVGHLMGQHAGHFLRRLGELDQAIEDHDRAARQSEGVGHAEVDDQNPEIVRAARGGRQLPGERGERRRAGFVLAELRLTVIEQRQELQHVVQHPVAERPFPGHRDDGGGHPHRHGEAGPQQGHGGTNGNQHQIGIPAQAPAVGCGLPGRPQVRRQFTQKARVGDGQPGRAVHLAEAQALGAHHLVDDLDFRVRPERQPFAVLRLDSQAVSGRPDDDLPFRCGLSVEVAGAIKAHRSDAAHQMLPVRYCPSDTAEVQRLGQALAAARHLLRALRQPGEIHLAGNRHAGRDLGHHGLQPDQGANEAADHEVEQQ